MDLAFCDGGPYPFRIHLLVVNSEVPDGKWGARGRPDDPIWIEAIDHGSDFTTVRSIVEVPWLPIWLQCAEIQGAQSSDVQVAPLDMGMD